MSGPLSEGRGGTRLAIHAQPGAARSELSGLHGGRLKVRVSAAPEDGRATAAIVELVADAFRLRRADVVLISGQTSRRKELILLGLPLIEAQRRLDEALRSGDGSADVKVGESI